MTRRLVALLGFCAMLGSGAQTLADTLQTTPFGGRTAAMGGAAIALGDDSAMPVLNPAGIALVPYSTASVSASVYSGGFVSIPKFNADSTAVASQFGPGTLSQTGLQSTSILSVPTSLAFLYHFEAGGRTHNLAGSVSIPRSQQRKFLQNLDTSNMTSFTIRDNTSYVYTSQRFLAGGSYAIAITPSLRVGAAILLNYAPTSWTYSLDYTGSLGNGADIQSNVTNASYDAFSADLLGNAGFQLDLGDNLSVGGVVQSKSVHLKGDFKHVENVSTFEGALQQKYLARTTGDHTDGVPLRIGGGVAFRKKDAFVLAGDVNLYRAFDGRVSDVGTFTSSQITVGRAPRKVTESVDERVPSKTVVNFSVGAEVRINEKNWLRAGAFTDFNTDPEVPKGTLTNDPTHCDPQSPTFDANKCIGAQHVLTFPFNRFGASLGWGTKTGPIDSTIGVSAIFGRGDTGRGIFDGQQTVYTPTQATTVDLLVILTAAVDVSDQKTKAREILKEELKANEQRIRALEQKAGEPPGPLPVAPPKEEGAK